MSWLGRAWRWLLAAVAVLPVVGWAVTAWLSERRERRRLEGVVAELGAAAERAAHEAAAERAAREAAQAERARIHAAYHADAERLAHVRAELERMGSHDVADAWDSAFGAVAGGAEPHEGSP